MKIAKIISLLGVVVMTAVLVYGFTAGDFFSEGSQLMAMPWGIVSLVDLYTGFILFSGWIIYRERSLPVAVLWTIAMMTLGFFAGSLYAFIALQTSGNDWRRFWMGRHARSE
jgi:predicted small integral membrane protein